MVRVDYGRVVLTRSAAVAMTVPDPITHTLSHREVAVIELILEGLTNRAIGSELHVSTSTVQAHVASAMRKLQARSRTHLAVRALRAGIVPLHPEDEP